jgi:hypothetical protein
MKAVILSLAALTILLLAPLTSQASLLSIHYPKTGQTVPSGFTASGTSAPSNSTHNNCVVQVRIDHTPYINATALGKALGNRQPNYTKWNATIPANSTNPGPNQIEGQLQCFASGNETANLVKHIVHNFTISASANSTVTATTNKTIVPPLAQAHTTPNVVNNNTSVNNTLSDPPVKNSTIPKSIMNLPAVHHSHITPHPIRTIHIHVHLTH